MTEAEQVGKYIAEDWADNCHENSQAELEAAIASLGLRLAAIFELNFGDDAVVSIAETLRTTADRIETKIGEFIQKDRAIAKTLARRYGENT